MTQNNKLNAQATANSILRVKDLKHTARAADTCSSCFDTFATAPAIFRFVTNMTSEKDHPCKDKGEKTK